MTTIFCFSKTHLKIHVEVASILHQFKLYRKSRSEWHWSFVHRNYSNDARWNDVKICWYWPVDIDSTCWVCWCNIRTKLVLVSTQSHRCFNIKLWRCFSVDKMKPFRRWNADPFSVNMKIIISWASQYKNKTFSESIQNQPCFNVKFRLWFDFDKLTCFEVQIRLSFQL